VHVLTKVFVVIASLLAVALSALVTANATNTDRVVRSYRDMENAKAAAEGMLRASELQHHDELSGLTNRLTATNKDIEALNAEILRFTGEISMLRKEKQDANNRASSIEGKISQLGEVAKTQATLIQSYRVEVTSLRDNELDFYSKQLDYEARINDLVSRNEVLLQTTRALQEELVEFQRGLAGGPTIEGDIARADRELAGPLVRGKIEEVREDVNGQMLVRINLGTNDNVHENTRLYAVRQKFIANLHVIRADQRWSLARVDTLNQGTQIQVGDNVLSRLQ